MRWPAWSCRCWPAGIATGDREQVRRTASALLGWTLLVLDPAGRRCSRCSPSRSPGCCSAAAPTPRSTSPPASCVVFAPQVVLYGIGIVLAGVLQAHRRFAGPALAPLLSSVVVAGAYLLFAGDGRRPRTSPTWPGRPSWCSASGRRSAWSRSRLCLLLPVRRLRLGLRPALRFPVGVAPRVARLALAGVLTLAGQQLVAAVAIRLANDGPGRHPGRLRRRADAVPACRGRRSRCRWPPRPTPGLAERAERGDRAGFARALAPVAVLVVAASAVAAACWSPSPGPIARVFLASDGPATVAALRDTIIAFAPGLVGYGAGRLPHPGPVRPRAVEGADRVRRRRLAARRRRRRRPRRQLCPRRTAALALGAGHTLGVTVAGLALLASSPGSAGPRRLAGWPRTGGAARWPPRRGRGRRAAGRPGAGRRPGARHGLLVARAAPACSSAAVVLVDRARPS